MNGPPRRALFICGSMNQTTQLHAVASELRELEVAFTPYYGNWGLAVLRRLGLVEMSIGGNRRRGWCLQYLRDHRLPIDEDGARGPYDLVVTCCDLVVPRNALEGRLVLVQEGILDPDGHVARLCRRFRVLPRALAGTALTGESFLYDRFCVASEGYRDRMIRFGGDPAKVVVTGIPNFDDCRLYEKNDFPHHHFVLVCTSDARETFKRDDRRHLVERALAIAAGRLLIFKLHPNENVERATREIREVAPLALVYATGNAEQMIANCDVLVTQWSSTVFVGMALGKEVYSNFAIDELRRLAPVQNGGMAARNIARVCRDLLAIGRPHEPTPPRRREPSLSQEVASP